MPDIRIVPGNAIMSFTSSLNFIERLTQDPSGSLNLYGSGSTGRTELLSVDGNNGRLFTVSDDLSDSLFSVNTIAGLPVIEAFANNSVNIGQYSAPPIKVTGSQAIITGSLFGTASWATNVANNGVTSIATNNGVTGGTITSTGTIGLATAYGDTINPYGSKTANTFLAAPNGSSGTPSFRAIAAADVPTLNQNTTGTATNATNVTVTTSTTDSAFKIPFANTTGASTGNYGLLQDSESGIFTYNPNSNRLIVPNISGSSINLNGGHALFNYIGTAVFTAAAGTTIQLGGGPGGVQNNVNVANGTLAVNQTSPQGRLHVYQPTTLGGTAGNNLILQTLQNTGGSGGNNVYIKDYALRDATGTSWTTWRHHNSIDIDGSHNTPGTNTKAFYERDPLSGLHEFGQEATYAVTIDGVNSRIGVATRTPSYPIHVNTSVSSISIYASADIVAYSDESVKENIRPIENVIQRIEQSRGVLYDRTDIESKDNIGFIAQELEVAFPELVATNEDGTKAVKYQNTVAVLFEAIKEQQKQIEELKQIVNGITG